MLQSVGKHGGKSREGSHRRHAERDSWSAKPWPPARGKMAAQCQGSASERPQISGNAELWAQSHADYCRSLSNSCAQARASPLALPACTTCTTEAARSECWVAYTTSSPARSYSQQVTSAYCTRTDGRERAVGAWCKALAVLMQAVHACAFAVACESHVSVRRRACQQCVPHATRTYLKQNGSEDAVAKSG